ncbi:Aldo/keto reductase [Eubacterium maltosivorans]|uniref:aldo/keto reductase n=1 Tax=Eubacterium maltosivorans TaxID=2041044 RepID=UPI000882717F|nr:aldo/keto reductase [Eubacterium maltosivorans]WPK82417.1 putative oxidoreductase YtbE [Eubacterium maltosivorans]SDO48215.1 Aldo/keto reductase [Eubacterium maltosivorans]
MKNAKLSNGIDIPMEGFGVFQVPEDQCEQVVLDAIETGYRLLDTASSYKNEEAVGSAVKKAIAAGMVKREDLFITTKAYIQQMGYKKTVQAFYESLNKLRLDYLDLYLIHMPLGDYYGAWRAMEDLYEAGKIRAIGVCNFDSARLMDLCYNARIRPMVNQIERHPHYQRTEELAIMNKFDIQPEGWAPFAEGLKGMFTEPVLQRIAEKHGKTVPQIILRWDIQQGVVIIPKSVHKNRMEENMAVWDFELDRDDMKQIGELNQNMPSMLDCSKPSEIDRLYDYLNNPVLTSL